MKLPFTVLLAGVVSAQSQPPEVTLRSTTRLVQMSVVAEDRSGLPVLDLKKDDFQVLDDNKPREIRVFGLNSQKERAPEPAMAAGKLIYTNAAAEQTGPNAITIIVIDSLNTKWTDQSRATRHLIQFLRQIRPEDHVAIYSLTHGGGFQVLHDFTRDSSDLAAALVNWKGEIPQVDPRDSHWDVGSLLAKTLHNRDQNYHSTEMMMDRDVRSPLTTMQAMEKIATSLKNVPGRKNMIWISDGFPVMEWGALALSTTTGCALCIPFVVAPLPLEETGGRPKDPFGNEATGVPQSFYPQFLRTMRIVDQANLAIYPLEARGLLPPPLDDVTSTAPTDYAHATQDVMVEIAKKTGGRAFINTNDISGAIRTAIEDSRVTYTLGFYADPVKVDEKFHNVKIRLVGRPGVTLRYRQGYLDETAPPSNVTNRKSELEGASQSPVDATQIRITATLQPALDEQAKLDLRIDLSTLNLSEDNGKHSGEFDVLLLQRDEKGEVFGRVNETVKMNFREETYRKMLAAGVPYQRSVAIDPWATVLRVVVREAATGNIGSITMPLKDVQNLQQ